MFNHIKNQIINMKKTQRKFNTYFCSELINHRTINFTLFNLTIHNSYYIYLFIFNLQCEKNKIHSLKLCFNEWICNFLFYFKSITTFVISNGNFLCGLLVDCRIFHARIDRYLSGLLEIILTYLNCPIKLFF